MMKAFLRYRIKAEEEETLERVLTKALRKTLLDTLPLLAHLQSKKAELVVLTQLLLLGPHIYFIIGTQ